MSKQSFFALAEQHDISVDHEPDEQWLQVWSPQGKVFNSSGCHTDASFQTLLNQSGQTHDWKACLANLKEVIANGFDKCPDGESCEICNLEENP